MSSKQLSSILSKIPSATAQGEKLQNPLDNSSAIIENTSSLLELKTAELQERIVAVIPKSLKEEIKNYIKSHKGETERIIILKALKLMGFNVPNEWLVDKRTTR